MKRLTVAVLVVLALFLLIGADKRSQMLSAYDDCITEQMRLDEYKGTKEQAWTLYANYCQS